MQIIAGAERVHSMRVLGFTVNQHLTMSDHVDNLIASGAPSIYALRMLRSHGFQPKQLVDRMTTIASLLYASSAWWGFTSAADRSKLERLVAIDLGAADTFRLIIHPLRTWR